MTSYGHANLYLKAEWQLMGAFEALNGMLLFGLTTAFLFAMIRRVWPVASKSRRRTHPRRPPTMLRSRPAILTRVIPHPSINFSQRLTRVNCRENYAMGSQ